MRRARVVWRCVIAVNFLVFQILKFSPHLASVGKIWYWLQRPSEHRPGTIAVGVVGGRKEETGAAQQAAINQEGIVSATLGDADS